MRLNLLFLLFLLVACGHGKLEFQSFPGMVDVSVISSDGQIRKLGETPLQVDMEDINFDSGIVKVLFTKTGYRDDVIFLTKPALRSTVKISTNMQEANSAKEVISNQKLERLSSKIAEAQKYSYGKNFQRAENILVQIIQDYPDVSVPYDLLANVYYLTNEYGKALHYYEKANVLTPGNTQRDMLINKLRREKSGNKEGTL